MFKLFNLVRILLTGAAVAAPRKLVFSDLLIYLFSQQEASAGYWSGEDRAEQQENK